MKLHHLLAAATLLAGAAAAQAVTFQGALTQGATTVADFSGVDLVSFDVNFANTAPAVLNFQLDAGDGAMPLSLSAMLRNFSFEGFGGYTVAFSAGSFSQVGSVVRQFGGTSSNSASGGTATMLFSSLEFLDVEVGDALGTTPGALNWRVGGLEPGQAFSVTVTPVPEPGTWAMLAAGLLAVGFVARRRG